MYFDKYGFNPKILLGHKEKTTFRQSKKKNQGIN
jgi:hypothetical protein